MGQLGDFMGAVAASTTQAYFVLMAIEKDREVILILKTKMDDPTCSLDELR